MRPRTSLFAALTCLALGSCDGASADDAEVPMLSGAEREQARALYQEHCALCHGEDGEGDGPRQSGLVGHPADFTDSSWRRRMTFRRAFDAIRNGKPGTSMPAWRVLEREEVRLLAAYVLSLSQGGGGSATESPGPESP